MAWTIMVCRRCGRVAQWPFCEHRDQAKGDDQPWCIAVTVRASPGSERRLRKMMSEPS